MAMLEIRNVQKTFRTYAKPGLFHRPGARKVISESARAARRRPDRGKGRCGGHSGAVRLRQDHPCCGA